MKTLHGYILRELAGPFLVSLTLLTFVLFMRHFVFLFPKIAGKNLGWHVLTEIIVLSLPFIIALVLPMAVLVAVIMAFGRLSNDNEITALKALGIPAHRLMIAPMAAACVLTVGATWFNDEVLPETNHRYKNLLMDIAYIKPTFQLREGVIMDDFPGMGLLVNRIEESGQESKLNVTAPGGPPDVDIHKPAELFGIVITQTTDQGTRRTIVADSGSIATAPNRTDAILTLFNGEIQEVDPHDPGQFQRMFFERHGIRLPDVAGVLQRGRSRRYRGDRELTRAMLQDEIAARIVDLDSLYAAAMFLADSIPEGDSTLTAMHKVFSRTKLPHIQRIGVIRGVDSLAALRQQTRGDSSVSRLSMQARLDTSLAADSAKADSAAPIRPGSAAPGNQITDYSVTSRLRQSVPSPSIRLDAVLREAGFIQRRLSGYQVEWWKKISIPYASIVFVLLGVPLGIISRKGGAGVSIAISMCIFLVYWVLLLAGETLADRHLLSPFWGMWSANALFLAIGVWLLMVQVRGRRSLVLVRGGFSLNSLRRLLGRQPKDAGEDES